MTIKPWERDYEATEGEAYRRDALARARARLDDVRSGAVVPRPAGRFIGTVILAVIFLVLPALGCLAAGFAMLTDHRASNDGGAIFFGFLFLPFAIGAFFVILGAKASTPKRALRLYFRSLGQGRTNKAMKLLIASDLDAFPRYQPDIPKLGKPRGQPCLFENPNEYREYWNQLLRAHPSPYCLVAIKSPKVKEIAPDVIVVDFRIQLIMNTSLWWLLILVSLFIALIVDIATRKVVREDLRKVLVRVGDEWHLLNGAWQEHDEVDLSWLEG